MGSSDWKWFRCGCFFSSILATCFLLQREERLVPRSSQVASPQKDSAYVYGWETYRLCIHFFWSAGGWFEVRNQSYFNTKWGTKGPRPAWSKSFGCCSKGHLYVKATCILPKDSEPRPKLLPQFICEWILFNFEKSQGACDAECTAWHNLIKGSKHSRTWRSTSIRSIAPPCPCRGIALLAQVSTIHWQDESYACWASQDVKPFPPRILQLRSPTWTIWDNG